MKTVNKVFLILLAALLILGALSLAVGIMLGGNLSAVFSVLWQDLSGFLDLFSRLG